MKKSTAASAALLSLLMLAAPVVSSCGEAATSSAPGQTASADGGNASADETTAPSSPDGLAPADFEGYDFRIASCNFFDHELATYLVYDELTGNPVNDELYNAKLNVENRFNVNIRWIELGDVDGVYNGVMKAVSAGEDAYDIAIGHDTRAAKLGINGYAVDLYSVPEFNFDQPWWPKEAQDSLSVAGKMFVASNYMSYCGLHWTRALIINKTIAQNYGKEIPYAAVRDGSWTLDKMFDLIAGTAADLDGNGRINKSDQLSFVTGVETFYCMQESFDLNPYAKDDKGIPTLSLDENRMQTMVEKMHRLIKETDGYLSEGSFGVDTFKTGQHFLSYSQIGDAYDTYRTCDFPYGFLPVPKLDESQKDYISCCTDVPWVIPNVAERLDVIGSVCEALSCYNYENVLPAYYEVAIKTRLADSPDDTEMLQLIVDTRTIGFAYIYEMPFRNVISDVASKSSPDLASYIEKNLSKAESSIENLVDAIESLA